MKKLITLEQSILDGQYKAYGFFRLKYFNLQLMFNYFVHLILIGIIFRHFTYLHASHLILIIAVTFIINSSWWGGLEVMREDIRAHFRRSMLRKISDIIGLWLFVSVVFSILLIVIAWVFLVKGSASIKELSSTYSLSFISFIFSLAIQLPVRVYHSGIYAISRVPRTTLSVFIADIIFILMLVISYPFLKLYSLPLSLFFKNMIAQVVTVYYVKQAYHLRDLAIKIPNFLSIKNFILSFPVKRFFKTSLSMTTFALDHLIIAIAFIYEKNNLRQEDVSFLVLIVPLLYASAEWARLFYFDYKKDIKNDFNLFYRHFEKKIIKIATYSGLFYWLLACLTHSILLPSYSMMLCFLLLPIFVLRSKIAILQIKYFSEGHYDVVIMANLFFWVFVVGIYLIPIFWIIKFVLLILVCMSLISYLSSGKTTSAIKTSRFKESTHVYAWLERLRNSLVNNVLEVHVFKISNNVKTKAINTLLKQLYIQCAELQYELCIYKKQILLFTPSLNTLSLEKLLLLTGGWVYHHECMEIASLAMVQTRLFPLLVQPISRELIHHHSIDEIKTTFFNYFPNGICFDPDYQLGPYATPLTNATLQKVILTTKKYLEDMTNNFFAGYFISIFYYSSTVKIIFLIPNSKFGKKNHLTCHPETWQKNIELMSKKLIFSH